MNDRELLELAAKAAGIDKPDIIHEKEGFLYYDQSDRDCESYTKWNPLLDDGDALRLAINLSMHIQHLDGARESRAIAGDEWIAEGWESGKDVATRRAIVRAAAEIGRNMP